MTENCTTYIGYRIRASLKIGTTTSDLWLVVVCSRRETAAAVIFKGGSLNLIRNERALNAAAARTCTSDRSRAVELLCVASIACKLALFGPET